MDSVHLNVKTAVKPNEVLFCEVEINYTRIYYRNRVELISVPLKRVEEQFHDFPFFRIHKSYLVNINYIVDTNSKYYVQMVNNFYLSISRRKIGKFNKILKRDKKK
ncbi:LytR/AlgR family response regulator transcription factor [Emticicia agri]|uniref:LytTR family transcriptional regulator n=1 Tax=Emticicia agri TaxID=2492393 RepID=A0A4Q5LTX0_9BACT|nr:LytTR family DNA-binding domain-containing protein [Emticicia agri]RYU92883.1 LytTR family transcriptional regulator [Emticicia agri]